MWSQEYTAENLSMNVKIKKAYWYNSTSFVCCVNYVIEDLHIAGQT